MMRMATAALMTGSVVQYHALEQTRSEVAMRMHSFISGTIGKELYRNLDLGQGRNFDLKAYREFLKSMKSHINGAMHVADTSRGRVSPLTIAAGIEKNNPDIVFVDYLTLMEKTGTGDWQSVAQLSGEMKTLAQHYGIPIIVASQLNRAAGLGKKDEPAGPEAISQSDAIGQDADAIVTMKQTSASVIRMMLAKYRHGSAGYRWWNEFRPGEGVFRECSYEKALALKDTDDDLEDEDE
jgi:replicative DNA helicase